MKRLSAAEIKRRGEKYFSDRKMPKCDKNGYVMRDEDGNVIYGDDAPYTVTGYAHAIGLSSVDDLFSFEDEERSELIKKALLRIESYAEEHLFNKDSFAGAKLFLTVNFKRWSACDASSSVSGEPESEETRSIMEKWGQ